MKPQSHAIAAEQTFENCRNPTRQDGFFKTMEAVVPWIALCEVIKPHETQAGNGRPPVGLERMPRTHFRLILAGSAAPDAVHIAAIERSCPGANAACAHGFICILLLSTVGTGLVTTKIKEMDAR
jgi:IS5 family transposase